MKQLPQGHALATASAEAPVNMAIGLFQLVESSEREGHHSFTVRHGSPTSPSITRAGRSFVATAPPRGLSRGAEPRDLLRLDGSDNAFFAPR